MWRYVVDTIVKRAGRLLIPFVIWGLIVFVRSRPADSLVAWFSLLFREPDNGLWFLLALFEISVVVVLCVWAARLILDRRGAANDATEALIVLAACLAVGSTLFWLLRYVFPALGLAMYYVKYVCLGIVYRRLCPSGIHPAVGVAAFAVFAALVPFWVWNAPPAIDWHPRFLDDRIVTALFDFVIAMSGTLVTIEVAQLISRHTPAIAVNVMTYCGRRTLDIYALHYFLLSYFPPVIGPIALSLLASFLLRQIPLAALILFGDAKDRPVWWPAVRGLTERGAGAPS
jgi:fucose 4-O-acetylase-like acetyltransferase